MGSQQSNDSRGLYAVLALATVLLGLASRRYAAGLPAWVGLYAGDALWALLLVWLLSLLRPAWPLGRVALVAGGLATAVEFSQLCQWPWLVTLRHTWWGHLVLGQGFLVSDLWCYAVGIGSGVGLRWGWQHLWPRASSRHCAPRPAPRVVGGRQPGISEASHPQA